MPFLKKVRVKNFKCFRKETSIDLEQATFLVGPNNAGKTALLAAIRCFFDTAAFSGSDLNKTEFAGKQEGFNRAEIAIEFDLNVASGKIRRKRLTSKYGAQLTVRKSFIYREATGTVVVEYQIGDKTYEFLDAIEKEAQEVVGAVSVAYIHPQEGEDLLQKAQEKFKQRLFNNWGRHASVSEQLQGLQKEVERAAQNRKLLLIVHANGEPQNNLAAFDHKSRFARTNRRHRSRVGNFLPQFIFVARSHTYLAGCGRAVDRPLSDTLHSRQRPVSSSCRKGEDYRPDNRMPRQKTPSSLSPLAARHTIHPGHRLLTSLVQYQSLLRPRPGKRTPASRSGMASANELCRCEGGIRQRRESYSRNEVLPRALPSASACRRGCRLTAKPRLPQLSSQTKQLLAQI
jgi:hypothetical protein